MPRRSPLSKQVQDLAADLAVKRLGNVPGEQIAVLAAEILRKFEKDPTTVEEAKKELGQNNS